jgi:hydrogenase maturation factor
MKKMGITVICGHTARYDNCHYPMVGGATVIGVGGANEYVSPKFSKSGDKIVITKGPAIEAVGILTAMFPRLIEKEFGDDFARCAETIFYKMSVVEDAMTAVSVGVRENGVVAMHDATECGIWGGLYELAEAAATGVRVVQEDIVVEKCVPEVCEYFDIDPYSSISEGTLIAIVRPHKADEVVTALRGKGIKASVVGELTEPERGMVLVKNGREGELKHPIVDPFWRAFYNALENQAS